MDKIKIIKKEYKSSADESATVNSVYQMSYYEKEKEEKENIAKFHFANCRSVSDFEKIESLGEGTYGTVFKTRDKTTGEIFAIKKIKMDLDSDGFPVTSIREIKILSSTLHTNIIRLKEVVVGYKKESIFLVFEYCEMDLVKMIEKMRKFKVYFALEDVKSIMIQLLKGVDYMHRNFILHRDLKLSNILLNKKGVIKIADFGLARNYSLPMQKYTPKVVTLWYRSPEILLDCGNYSWASDLWALGCIFGELLNEGNPLLPGNNEVNQYELICNLIGSPNQRVWPEFFNLPVAKKLLGRVNNKYNNIPQIFKRYSPSCIDLLNSLLTWDPKKRISASQALLHDFFTEYPYPKHPSDMAPLKLI